MCARAAAVRPVCVSVPAELHPAGNAVVQCACASFRPRPAPARVRCANSPAPLCPALSCLLCPALLCPVPGPALPTWLPVACGCLSLVALLLQPMPNAVARALWRGTPSAGWSLVPLVPRAAPAPPLLLLALAPQPTASCLLALGMPAGNSYGCGDVPKTPSVRRPICTTHCSTRGRSLTPPRASMRENSRDARRFSGAHASESREGKATRARCVGGMVRAPPWCHPPFTPRPRCE